MELQKPQEDPRKKTLDAADRLPEHPPAISSSLHQQPTSQGNAVEPSEGGGEGVEQKGTQLPAPAAAASEIDAASGSTAAAAEESVAGPVTDIQRKLLRAERFGMPVQLSEEEKRSSRSERFGIGAKVTGEFEEQKRKARAERFGLAGVSTVYEEAKKKARSERFAENPKPDSIEEEKRKARAIRFAPASRASSEANDKADSELKAAVAKT